MAGELLIGYDPSRDPGDRLPPEVIAEIALVAPSTVNDGSITEPKIATNAVTNEKIAPGAVQTASIGTGEVKNGNLGTNSVTTAKIQDEAITPAKAGPGIMKLFDGAGNPIDGAGVVMSFSDYGDIDPDPTTLYFLTP